MLDVTNDDVAAAVAELVRCRLAILYDSDGTKALQLLKFADHQTGMRYDREAPSKYGPPPDLVPPNSGPGTSTGNDSGPDNSGPTPPKVKGSEVKSREGKASTRPKKRKGPMPKDWQPNDTARKKAAELSLDLDDEAENFRIWPVAKGVQYVDWDAGFLNHLKSQAKRRDQFGHKGSPQADQEEAALTRRRQNQAAQERAQREREARDEAVAVPVGPAAQALLDGIRGKR
jgi:hypothetical protein